MIGYGFSIWYVPYDWKEIKKKYKMAHIPHITYMTNMKQIPNIEYLSSNIVANKFTAVEKFKPMYSSECLKGMGWYCKVPLKTDHRTHMTLKYYLDEHDLIQPDQNPIELKCFCCIADTRSRDQSKWFIL